MRKADEGSAKPHSAPFPEEKEIYHGGQDPCTVERSDEGKPPGPRVARSPVWADEALCRPDVRTTLAFEVFSKVSIFFTVSGSCDSRHARMFHGRPVRLWVCWRRGPRVATRGSIWAETEVDNTIATGSTSIFSFLRPSKPTVAMAKD
jgi:hypothetical protein